MKPIGFYYLLVIFLAQVFCVSVSFPRDSKKNAYALLAEQLPVTIEDVDLGYSTKLLSNGQAELKSVSGKPMAGTATWKIQSGFLKIERKFYGSIPNPSFNPNSSYPIQVKKGKVLIDHVPSDGKGYWMVNVPD